MTSPVPWTANDLGGHLQRLGVRDGDTVMVHAAVSRIGLMLNGPDTVIDALRATVGAGGTIMGYTDWEAPYFDLLDEDGRLDERLRPHVQPFRPASSRAARANGVLVELLRTTPGALRSGNPGASVAALGRRAAALTADHPLQYGYGPGSPLARLVDLEGKVLMLGAPLDTMTLLHHAEHLADLEGKRTVAYEVPLEVDGATVWHRVEEFDTSRAVVPALDEADEEPFAQIVSDHLRSHGRTGTIGGAESVLVDAAEIVAYAVDWFERLQR